MLKPGAGWEREKRISLVRNDGYFGAKPHLDGIDFVIFAHGTLAAANYQAFQAGELDVSSVLIGLRRAAETAYSPRGGFLLALPFTVSYIAPSTANGPLSNPDARRAVALAIDREAIARSLRRARRRIGRRRRHDCDRRPAVRLLPPGRGLRLVYWKDQRGFAPRRQDTGALPPG
jgi:ABC-type transport system substrate-binding protein